MSRDEKPQEEKKPNGRPHHTGSVVAEDEHLTLWLNKLWARNEPPERLEVYQAFGRNKSIRGEMIFHDDFKHGEKLDVEQANKLANDIIDAAQNDTDSRRRESYFQIAIIDRNRKSSPLVRLLGPLTPKRVYMTRAGEGGEDDEDTDALDGKSLALKYVQEGLVQSRWDKQRNDRILGDVITLLASMVQELRADRHTLMTQQMSFFTQLQEAHDRALDREIIREKEKFKIGLYKDGVRTARNLLPGLFGDNAPVIPAQQPNGANGHNPNVQNYGASRERTLVDNFLNDCEESEISVPLFGDFEIRDGKLAQTKPGIFALEQFKILVGVREGKLGPHELDALLPEANGPLSVKPDQIKAAADAGMSEGVGLALLELVNMRRKAKAAAEAQPEAE